MGCFYFCVLHSRKHSFFSLSQIYLPIVWCMELYITILLIALFLICLIFKDSLPKKKKKSEIVEKNYIKGNPFVLPGTPILQILQFCNPLMKGHFYCPYHL